MGGGECYLLHPEPLGCSTLSPLRGVGAQPLISMILQNWARLLQEHLQPGTKVHRCLWKECSKSAHSHSLTSSPTQDPLQATRSDSFMSLQAV